MPHGPQKLILIRAGRYDYAEVELAGSIQIVGPNNTGKTTLINTLQFLYLDDRRQMDFGSYTPEQTRDYYFPDQYSYILFECLGARGRCVLGWRGTSRAAGGDPERFVFDGPYDPEDFRDERNQVREPKVVNGRLALRGYTVLRSAQEHRELLQMPTRGDSGGLGLVALRDNDRYPHFRETLKNLLSLSTITQDQMRDRLLMLAGLPTDRHALDIRELFGDDYDRILRLKQKLLRFKQHQNLVERLVDLCARRDGLRNEQLYRWSELKAQRQAFEQEHQTTLDRFAAAAQAAAERLQILAAEVEDRRTGEAHHNETRGVLRHQLNQLNETAAQFRDFAEDLGRASLINLETDIRRRERQLGDAATESREKAEQKIKIHRELVEQKRRTLTHFDRALITVLRRHLTDDELGPLARLFQFELLEMPVGDDGIRLLDPVALVTQLRALGRRIAQGTYRDDSIEIPLPHSSRSLAELEDPGTVREQLADYESTLHRWEGILAAIADKESLLAALATARDELTELRKRLILWEQFQQQKAMESRWEAELRQTEDALAAVRKRLGQLEREQDEARKAREMAHQGKVAAENAFNAVMGRFNTCLFPDCPGKAQAPAEATPDDFDAAIAIFLRQQQSLLALNGQLQELFFTIEKNLGSDFIAGDESETIRLLREELEALGEREEVLRRDWEHHLTHLRGTFDQVLQALNDLKSAADRLNRALAGIQVSNLRALRMDVVEQSDIVGSLRRLAAIEQPGLFDDSSGIEAALGAFRQKFEANPLLRHADLFTLRFTVTGDDGRPHQYHDFRQVESHGTTITIKVLFNLLVLRSLLREDAQRGLLSEIPFFLDEVHSLDATNRHAILSTARRLGFIAITAAPEAVGEVGALYFLQPHGGRIVLRHQHRVGIKVRRGGSA